MSTLYQTALLKLTVGRLAAAFEFLADIRGDHDAREHDLVEGLAVVRE